MKRLILTAAIAIMSALLAPIGAQAAFGLKDYDVTFTDADGAPAMQAGAHPFALTTSFDVNTREIEGGGEIIDGGLRDVLIAQVEGQIGDPAAVPRCSLFDFSTTSSDGTPGCADSTALGHVIATLGGSGTVVDTPLTAVYSIAPPPGVAAKLGFVIGNVPTTVDLGLTSEPPYRVLAASLNTSQLVEVLGIDLTLWGNPADSAHDELRGHCLGVFGYGGPTGESCPANIDVKPFLTVPRSCTGPAATIFSVASWWSGDPFNPGPSEFFERSAYTHDGADPPNPLGFTGCGRLAFNPSITAKPTSRAGSSPTGLDFSLDVADEGIGNPSGIAHSDIEKTVVTLPEGFSVNPSIAAGLQVCSEADLERETLRSEPGAGCPNASKIGSVEVESPLLEESVNGALFQATPYENPFDSLIALYIVIKNPTLGIIVKQPLNVIPDPVTGQLTTVAEDMPQLPFSHFKLHFREGARSPLATPPGCGTYDGHDPAHEPVRATLYPSSGGAPIESTAVFQLITGPNAGPCPSGGLPPFKPGLIAGSINNAAGRFSPFNVRLFRNDSEQEITHFSIKLPPGITAKLAGVPYCSDAQIAAATARTGPHGGAEELASPSCPAASEIGHTLVGGGVGSALAYAPGKVYLAGPYNGSNLSIVAITAGIVGPFDIGTVVVREALKIDPETAEAFIDATGSDPIPHIIKGVPVHLRDIRVYTDRPNFVLNPTDCTRTSTASTVLGSGLDFGSEADDRPITVSTPYQAADCAALPFKPKLGLRLIGGTRRGAFPAFRATLRMGGIGEAGIARAEVTLPKSEFIAQAHFNTICTKVQFKAGAGNGANCPAGSIYGKARAITPILGEPLTGPVFLRSSEHQLPDLVVALANKQVDFNLVGHVDSVKGRLRNTFEAAPDAPVSSFVLEMRGGKKGLFENSTNLCKGAHKAESNFTGQNGKVWNTKPELKVKCKGKAKKGKAAKHKRRAH